MKSLPSSSAGHAEGADLKPDGVRGRWWHEVLRGLGKIQGLNTGVIRCGAWYGPGTWEGLVIPRLVVGHVYKHLGQKMEFLYKWVISFCLIPLLPSSCFSPRVAMYSPQRRHAHQHNPLKGYSSSTLPPRHIPPDYPPRESHDSRLGSRIHLCLLLRLFTQEEQYV